jgi:hypothetical protein
VFSYIDSHTKLKKPVGLLFYACFIFSGYPLSVGISKGSSLHLAINGMNVDTRCRILASSTLILVFVELLEFSKNGFFKG